MQGTRVVFNTTTDDFGRYRAHNLDAGTYAVSVPLGFRAQTRPVDRRIGGHRCASTSNWRPS